MNIDQMIARLQGLREAYGSGEVELRIAYQPRWPLAARVAAVNADMGPAFDPDFPGVADARAVWIATGPVSEDENPYAPEWAWDAEEGE
jgi:hypothetical protein